MFQIGKRKDGRPIVVSQNQNSPTSVGIRMKALNITVKVVEHAAEVGWP